MNHRGEVVTPLDRDGAAAAIDRCSPRAWNRSRSASCTPTPTPAHEAQVGAMIRERAPHVALTLSSEILPEMREFERTSTAVTNAYVMPGDGPLPRLARGELRALEARARSSSCSPTAAS
jgi:N-methylhydantoinase A/oxoprolinase/acetone carboxylase beta subunit